MAEKIYDYIYKELKSKIINGDFAIDRKLPSENILSKKYNATRNTIRRAFKMLSDEGLVASVKGKGVFVLDNNQINVIFGDIKSFYELSQSYELKTTTEIYKFEKIIVDDKLSKQINFPEKSKIINIIRIRKIKNETVIIDNNYFLEDIVKNITKKIAKKSIYDYIENELKLRIFGAQKMITIELLNSLDKKLFNLKEYNCVGVIRRCSFLEDGRQFEFTESRHHPSKFIFTTFAHRNNKNIDI